MSELVVDKKHKFIDLSLLRRKGKKGFSIGPLALSLMLFSGCGKTDELQNDTKVLNTDTTSVSDTIDYGIEESNYTAFNDNKEQIEIVEHKPTEIVKIPHDFYTIVMDDGSVYHDKEISYGDLAKVTSVKIFMYGDTDYSLLNYMPKLEAITFFEKDNNCKIRGLDGSRLPRGIDISFYHNGSQASSSFDYERFPFLADVENISRLQVGDLSSYDLSSSYINSIKAEELFIYVDGYCNFKNLDFRNISTLILIGEPYNIAMYVSKDDINKLRSSSINVKIIDNNGLDITDEVLEISDKIDSIYSSLEINSTDSDIEKLDKILTYVLSEYTYDPQVKDNNSTDVNNGELISSFYTGGILYAAMEKDTQICGNFASMTFALCKRAGLDNFFLASEDHSWNAVQVGDYYYYVDSTWLDGCNITIENHKIVETLGGSTETITYESKTSEELFKEDSDNIKSGLSWYLEDPTSHPDKEHHHDLKIEPYDFEIVDVPDDVRNKELGIMVEDSEEQLNTEQVPETTSQTTETTLDNVQDLTDKKFKVTLNGKTYIIGAAALFGILSSIGIGVLVHKKREKDRRRREQLRRQLSSFDNDFPDFHSRRF